MGLPGLKMLTYAIPVLGFHMGFGDLNSGCQACMANVLSTEPDHLLLLWTACRILNACVLAGHHDCYAQNTAKVHYGAHRISAQIKTFYTTRNKASWN